MNTQKSEHVFSVPAIRGHPPNNAGTSLSPANMLAIYGCGKPVGEYSSTNSSTITSVTSNAGSDDGNMSVGQRRSPFSSNSSDLDARPPPPSAPVTDAAKSAKSSATASDTQPKPNIALANTTNSNNRSKSKSIPKNESHKETETSKGGTQSPRGIFMSSQRQQQQRMCSFYSEPVSWKQDSNSQRDSNENRSPADDEDTGRPPVIRKETNIAVQRNTNPDAGGRDKDTERSAGGRLTKSAGIHAKREHQAPTRVPSSERLPLHRILNDPRVFYVIAFTGLAALVVVSAAGITLAARRRRRRRRRHSLVNGLGTAKDMVAALVTTWVNYSRWLRRLLFK